MRAVGSARPSARSAVAGLGERLSQFFDRLVDAPLPAHMADLIDQLEQAARDAEGAATARVEAPVAANA